MNKIAKYFWLVIAIINTVAICSIALSLHSMNSHGISVDIDWPMSLDVNNGQTTIESGTQPVEVRIVQ
jgi:hypothetical protein